MKYVMASFVVTLLLATFCQLPVIEARTTPADIYNDQKASYDQRLSTFSPSTQQKITSFTKAINDTNKKETYELEMVMERQGQILDEYMRRNGKTYRVADGVNRNLSDPIENANYWITYAHEAVAYQAAKNYLPSLSSENNWKNSASNNISNLASDINILKGKVEKSRLLVERVVSK